MAPDSRLQPDEREIATFVIAEVEESADALRDAGIDARVLGDPAVALRDRSVRAWSDRMGIAVPGAQADRALQLLREREAQREARIRAHTKGLWRVALRVVATCACIAVLSFLAGGSWRDYPVLFSVLAAIVLVTVTLDVVKLAHDRRARKPGDGSSDWFDERRGRSRRR